MFNAPFWEGFMSDSKKSTDRSRSALGVSIASLVAVVVGWFVLNSQMIERDHRNKQLEIRIAYLLDAFEVLAVYANRIPAKEDAASLEKAVAKIRLLGDEREIALLNRLIDEWSESARSGQPRADADPLLDALRGRV
jgi:hypothetical protein